MNGSNALVLLLTILPLAPRVVHAETARAPGAEAEVPSRDVATDAQLAAKVRIEEPDGFFSHSSLQTYFARSLPPATVQHLVNSSDAVYVSTSASLLGNGRLYCFAYLGLTEAAPKDRNARVPAVLYGGVRRVDAGGDQSSEGIRVCRDGALAEAVGSMSKDSLEAQLVRIDKTRGVGGRVLVEPADPSRAHLFWNGGSEAVQQAVFGAITTDLRRAFDYRKLQWVALGLLVRLDGRTVCHGQMGVSARAPDGRNPRVPGFSWMRTWEMTEEETFARDAEDTCRRDVFQGAVKSMREASWDAKGLLSGFDVTREDGVALPRPAKRPAPAPRPRAATPARVAPTAPSAALAKCQPPTGKVLRYHDRCSNGDCTRTFENGCSVRFDAPYCYDAVTGSWGWKPDGC
ncbi:MAG: hypothetical protein ABW252_11610 [Polyangiales bacterium]